MNNSRIIELLSNALRTKHGCDEEQSKKYGLIVFRQMKRGVHPRLLRNLWNDKSVFLDLLSRGYADWYLNK